MKHLIKGTTYDSVLNQINNGELKTKPLIISTQDDGGDTNCFFLPKRQVHFKHEITNELIELIKLTNTNVELQMIGLSEDYYELTNDGYIYDSFVVNGVEMTQPLSEIITTEYGPKYIENEQRSVIHNLDNVIPFNSNEDIVGVFDEKLTSDNPYVSIILGMYGMTYLLLAHSQIQEVCENENVGLTFNDKNLTISKDFALNVAKLVVGEDAPAELLESYGFSVHLLFSNTEIEGFELLGEGASRNSIKNLYADNLLPLTIDYKFTGNDYDVIKFNNKNINWVHDFFITFERQLKDDDYFLVYGQILKISSDFMTALWTTSDNQTFYPNLMFVEYFIHMYDETFLPIFDVDGNRIKYKLSYRSGGTPTVITVPLKPSEIDVVAEISPMLYKKNMNSVVGALYEWWQEDNYDGYTTTPTLSHSYLIAGSGGIHLFNKSLGIKEIELPNDISFIPGCFCENMSNLKTINIPKSVTKILGWAFNGCTNLQNIKLHNNITQINQNAFSNCTSLTSINIPSSVTTISDDAFYNCSGLTSVIISNGVTSIASNAFYNCSGLTSVIISNGVTSIASNAFYNCSSLTSVIISNGVTSIDDNAFRNCSSLTSVTIPNSVTTIGSSAFYNCSSLTSVAIGSGVTSITGNTFSNCSSLTSVTIPNSVTSIGHHVFDGCTSLTSVVIPDSVTTIGYNAFDGCGSLTSVTIPSSVTSVNDNAFYGCYFQRDKFINNSSVTGYPWGATLCDIIQDDGLCISGTTAVDCRTNATNVTIPNSVIKIGNDAFRACTSLTSVTIPNSVTTIGSNTFSGCTSLTSVTIPDSVIYMGYGTFSYCSSLTSVIIPDSITEIDYHVFGRCTSLTSITIPSSVTEIGSHAFYDCTSLTSITIPSSVTSIGDLAFYSCTSLTSITIPSSVTSVDDRAFYNCYFEHDKFINNSSATGYPWSATICDIIQEDGLCIEGTTVVDCRINATNVTIPDSVTSIGSDAFQSCSSLTSVTIPDSVTSIGSSAFEYCRSLTSVTIPDSVTSIGSDAFQSCSSLTSVTIGSGVTSIGGSAFYYCSGLTSIEIPDSVTSIGSSAFTNCYDLTSVTIPSSVTSIGYNAFYNTPFYNNNLPNGDVYLGSCYYKYKGTMPSNTSITIKDGTKSISDYAFSNCSSLTSVTIPDSVTEIGNGTFNGCYFERDKLVNNSSATGYPWNANLYDVVQEDGLCISGITAVDCRPNATNVTIPDGVTNIGGSAFYYCRSLISVTIPDGVTNIGGSAFYGCSSLTSVTIGSGVTSVGNNAFYYCNSLNSITCHATTAPTLSGSVFYNLPSNGTLYVPSGSDYSSWLSALPSGWTIEYK